MKLTNRQKWLLMYAVNGLTTRDVRDMVYLVSWGGEYVPYDVNGREPFSELMDTLTDEWGDMDDLGEPEDSIGSRITALGTMLSALRQEVEDAE